MATNVLILTVDSWNLNICANSSYTYSTLFSGMDEFALSNIYLREELPNDPCCRRYFQISENKVIRSLFHRNIKTGREVWCGMTATADDALLVRQQQQLYAKQRRRLYYTKKMVREVIWKLSAWKSRELDLFLEDVRPDIVIFSMEGYIHFNRLCLYVLKKTGAKGIGYFWDDNFTYKQRPHHTGYKILRFFQRKSLKKLAGRTDAFWAISPKTKTEADQFFGIDCVLIPKPAERENAITYPQQPVHGYPVRMLYTGNLMIGRMDTIRVVADTLSQINKERIRITLDVYTATAVSDELKNHGCGVTFHEPVSQQEVLQLQQHADVLLFAEDIVGEERKVARLSFSTKIPDYLSSGKCILAIGDNDTAPMEYFRGENIALCAGDAVQLREQLEKILSDPDLICAYGRRAAECAKNNHAKETVRHKVKDMIDKVLQK